MLELKTFWKYLKKDLKKDELEDLFEQWNSLSQRKEENRQEKFDSSLAALKQEILEISRKEFVRKEDIGRVIKGTIIGYIIKGLKKVLGGPVRLIVDAIVVLILLAALRYFCPDDPLLQDIQRWIIDLITKRTSHLTGD